jgi:hypothetical protein
MTLIAIQITEEQAVSLEFFVFNGDDLGAMIGKNHRAIGPREHS